jgi:hypothetical protein
MIIGSAAANCGLRSSLAALVPRQKRRQNRNAAVDEARAPPLEIKLTSQVALNHSIDVELTKSRIRAEGARSSDRLATTNRVRASV